jgi:hypothetical protein
LNDAVFKQKGIHAEKSGHGNVEKIMIQLVTHVHPPPSLLLAMLTDLATAKADVLLMDIIRSKQTSH